MRLSALHIGTEHHLLDHIAPLCDLLKMPLYLTDDPDIARFYYPQIQTIHWPDLDLSWGRLAEQTDIAFRCGYWPAHFRKMLKDLHGRDLQLVFCPHGQSDKGLRSQHLYPYAEQENILLYGSVMQEMLQTLDIWPPEQKRIFVGNYRLRFYRRHQSFYDDLAEKEIMSRLRPDRRTLLYAPTWQDAEDSGSFFSFGPKLIESAPDHWNIIIKPHPLIEKRNAEAYHSLAGAAEKKDNILLIENFLPIYPILNRTDVYLGDSSSIGYDFLTLERPMFFVFPAANRKPGRLQQCGLTLDGSDPFQFIEGHLSQMTRFIPRQRALDQHAFKCTKDIESAILRSLKN